MWVTEMVVFKIVFIIKGDPLKIHVQNECILFLLSIFLLILLLFMLI